MKRLLKMRVKLFFVLIPFIMIACAEGQVQYVAPELPADLCMEFPVEKSLIRRVAAENNVPLNELYYGLIDATAIAMITDALEKESVKNYLVDVEGYILRHPRLSYSNLIRFMTAKEQWGEEWPLIEGVVLRRIQIFGSTMWISEHDRCLILAGLAGAQRDLYL